MNKIKKLFFVICLQSLGTPYVLAHQHCIHPIEEEKVEFYFINLPANTCIERVEIEPFMIKKNISPDYLCERKTNGLTRKKVEELLISKETPSIICNVIKGRFSQCNTAWGGKVTYVNHWKVSESPWAEIRTIVDKKNRLVQFSETNLSDGNEYPMFEWNPPIPNKFIRDPYLYSNRAIPGTWRGDCGLFPIKKFIPYRTTYSHKNVFFVDKKKGYFGMRKVNYIKFGQKINDSSQSADF